MERFAPCSSDARPASDTVLGDFNNAIFQDRGKTWRFYTKGKRYFAYTDDVAGAPAEFEIIYTFGWAPLQQYMVAFPGGRLQCLPVAWDVYSKRWFSLNPDQQIRASDWLHWTRPAQNWNTMCSQCHSTGVQKRYDPATDSYRTTWAEISVGCEACHGPGSQHVEWGRKPAIGRPQISNAALTVKTASMQQHDLVNLCAACHSRRAELKDMTTPASEPLSAHLPVLLTQDAFYPDGQIQDEDYEVHSFLQSKMFEKGVKCNDCHDVHRAKRYTEGNMLCLKCHRADTYDVASHHFHKKIVDGKESPDASCVECHMPVRNLGLLLAQMGKNSEAEASLRKALKIDPDMAPAAYNLAVLVGARDSREAAALCKQAVELQPGQPKYEFSLAYYQMQNEDKAAAILTLEKLVRAYPAYADAVLMLGDLYQKQNRIAEAASLYDQQLAMKELQPEYRQELQRRQAALPRL